MSVISNKPVLWTRLSTRLPYGSTNRNSFHVRMHTGYWIWRMDWCTL